MVNFSEIWVILRIKHKKIENFSDFKRKKVIVTRRKSGDEEMLCKCFDKCCKAFIQ